MYNGFGGRRGAGRGVRGGIGLGFRGASPPWPYVGLGRGGLPRCGYFLNNNPVPVAGAYGQTMSPFGTGAAPRITPEQDLDSLRNQAKSIGAQLERIEKRMRELEGEK